MALDKLLMVAALTPWAANGWPLSKHTFHLLFGRWEQCLRAKSSSGCASTNLLSNMKVHGFCRAAGACKAMPLAWAANLDGSPPAIRQVEATTTGNPKPMM